MPELDHALEWCENEIIAQHQDREGEEASLRDWFTEILGTEHDAQELIQRCQRLEVDAGEIIVSAGDAADSMHFILDGRVGIMIPAGEGRTTRVRSLGRYTTIGEMGLVSQAPRSATIQAEVASVLYVLSTHQFEAIKTREPGARPEAADLFRLCHGRAADLRQPHDRGAQEVAEDGAVVVWPGRSTSSSASSNDATRLAEEAHSASLAKLSVNQLNAVCTTTNAAAA